MIYKISSLVQEKTNGEITRQVLTLEATYQDGSVSEHGFELTPEDTDIKMAAIKYAAQLEGVLKERPLIVSEKVILSAKEREIKDTDVQAKITEIRLAEEAAKIESAPVEPLSEPTP